LLMRNVREVSFANVGGGRNIGYTVRDKQVGYLQLLECRKEHIFSVTGCTKT